MPPAPQGYDAIRRSCALLPQPGAATVEVRGDDRHAFLNRMLTQAVSAQALPPGRATRSFWLNRKGRIDADLAVLALEDRILLDVDASAAARVVTTLGAFLFAEDVRIEDATPSWARWALHGPAAWPTLLGAVGGHDLGNDPPEPGEIRRGKVARTELVVRRQDSAGETGLELHVTAETNAASVVDLFRVSATPVDFGAWNVARIEAGWPLFGVDFDADSLPHETGALRDRVSFTKGCYLGQEVVARMESLGQPKQRLVAIVIGAAANDAAAPTRGDAVTVAGVADAVGRVTSAASCPALGDRIACFAQVRTKHAAAGTRVGITCANGELEGEIQHGLRLLPGRG